eukprot:364976-Chlamydomonas_euryale.AAC.9
MLHASSHAAWHHAAAWCPTHAESHLQWLHIPELITVEVNTCAQQVHDCCGVDQNAHALLLHHLVKLCPLVCTGSSARDVGMSVARAHDEKRCMHPCMHCTYLQGCTALNHCAPNTPSVALAQRCAAAAAGLVGSWLLTQLHRSETRPARSAARLRPRARQHEGGQSAARRHHYCTRHRHRPKRTSRPAVGPLRGAP